MNGRKFYYDPSTGEHKLAEQCCHYDNDHDAQNRVGQVAACSRNRVAIITHVEQQSDGRPLFMGVGLDGCGAWQSLHPVKISDNIREYYKTL